MKDYHVLVLGGDVQSTTLYLMFLKGELKPQLDCAIFADTGEMPSQVYRHLEWMQSLNGPPILIRSAGKLGDAVIQPKQSFCRCSIPAFSRDSDGSTSMGRRQCTKEFRVDVIEKTIREDVVGLKPGEWFPTGQAVVIQYLGLGFDEVVRVARVRGRFVDLPWCYPVFPLVQKKMGREECRYWLHTFAVPHEVPLGACTLCPYRSNADWRWLRDNEPTGFQRAIQIDRGLRFPTGTSSQHFVHRSGVPLSEASLDLPEDTADKHIHGFYHETDGVCAV